MTIISNQARAFDPANHADISWFLHDAKRNGCTVSVIEQPNGNPGLLIVGGEPSVDHLAITEKYFFEIAAALNTMNGGKYV